MDNFIRTMRNQAVPIDQQLNTILQEQINKNREILSSLLKSVIFCGQSNIALRGHRDDNPRDKPIDSNFHSLLKFRVDSGDTTLDEHLSNAPRNATYTSKTIQNEMISTVASYILEKISGEIKESKYFSVLADEAADISNKENISIVVRFVDTSNTIREEFVGFYQCNEGTTGEAIKNLILEVIVQELGLSMVDCRGQCYDGAGSMAGIYNGASSLITAQFPKAVYVHCQSHRLNLCVADTCAIPMVKNMMGTVKKISDFFHNSPKRHDYLLKKIDALMPGYSRRVLMDVCRTRWITRIDGLDRLVELLEPVIATLDDISQNTDAFANQQWNHTSRTDAQTLLNAVTFPFIVTLVIVGYILDLTRPLTKELQSVQMDMMKANNELENLKSALQQFQTDIDNHHHILFTKATDLAGKIQILPAMPRIVQRQIHRANAPATTPENYYRINLTTVFLDHVTQQLDKRFQQDQLNSYTKGLSIIPKTVVDDHLNWKTKVKEFCHEYRSDIPNAVGLDAELFMWGNRWLNVPQLNYVPSTIKDTLKSVDRQAYPNVFTILQLLATIPVTSSSCERSISKLRLIKTYLRNTMTDYRMNGLALMYAHKEIELNIDTLINKFATMHPRRMRMTNILDDGN